MRTAGTARRPLARPDDQAAGGIDEALAAQRLACRVVVAGCERALFELRCSLGRASAPAGVRTGLQAVELLEEVLLGWREALAALGEDSREDFRDSGAAPILTPRSPPLTTR